MFGPSDAMQVAARCRCLECLLRLHNNNSFGHKHAQDTGASVELMGLTKAATAAGRPQRLVLVELHKRRKHILQGGTGAKVREQGAKHVLEKFNRQLRADTCGSAAGPNPFSSLRSLRTDAFNMHWHFGVRKHGVHVPAVTWRLAKAVVKSSRAGVRPVEQLEQHVHSAAAVGCTHVAHAGK